ncbi:MAG TPA: acylneuraminate cytidylyltransferase [Anaerolineaceae bacterium]|nr:acylneuraminate cytidylyltransferase [Anaerolineaceae bacterium]HOU42859.1 acylneuraminate cytidylyltransferase [Anaerolineaceae bacterium]HPA34401.1 acylneuraminate cytidylyltransferase [Anaerolineaceae bacterium]HQF44851.1 acylneuraminate cytidylyltransferase [Anaerolineaceae bacterium]HQH34618.1 acylneuraminate cytidylyltransferase [Anaerolineaceae bacterium]
MVKRPEVLAIIPARGGSKGIPRKNIRSFAGAPLIAWSIAAAQQSNTVTRVIVSTDDEEIAAVARQYGAETPFLRPAEFAQDQTTDLPVFEHALDWLAAHEQYQPNVVVQLRPTSPVRPVGLVDDAVQLLLSRAGADSVRGVVPAGQNPHKMWKIDPVTGVMHPLLAVPGIDEPYNAPRQVLPPVYWQTGHVDAIRPRVITEDHSMSGKVILPVLVDPRYTVDIDNPADWQRAEWVVFHGGLEMVRPAAVRRPLPKKTALLVLDFDGVLTDNRVWTDLDGREFVASSKSDSMGLSLLQNAGVQAVVLSSETNGVVAARCQKIKVPYLQGILDKPAVLKSMLAEHGLDPAQVVYLGNDVNDTPCFPLVGCAVVTADAEPEAKLAADLILEHAGGQGAIRELCRLILARLGQ